MANLNFQQPLRSIAGNSLPRGAGGAFGGRVSPPAFPPAAPPAPPPPLLPGRAALFGHRAAFERRTLVSGLPGSNPMVAVRGGGLAGTGEAPPLLDPSEFPSLTRAGPGPGGDAPHHHGPSLQAKPYVGMVKQPTAEQSEFTMSSEDFPALPGTSAGAPGAAPPEGAAPGLPPQPPPSLPLPDLGDKARHGIHTSPDGKVSNIPGSMVPNQFGIVGLLTFIRAAESDPELVSLALGQDLTTLGLNLNSPDNLYLTFAGPWAEAPCRAQDIDYHVPPEYLINMSIREKLAPLKLNRYKEDLLFYLFYCFVGDVLQLAAASELYNREWRYHTEEKVWITQAPGVATLEKTTTYERGTYYYFDAHSWRKVAKEFHLDYSKLEGRPQLPAHFHA